MKGKKMKMEMNGQKGHSENDNNEKQPEDEGQENKHGHEMNGHNEDNIFITQSSFTPNESVQFDIDVNQIFEYWSFPQ